MARIPILDDGDKLAEKHLPDRLSDAALNNAYAGINPDAIWDNLFAKYPADRGGVVFAHRGGANVYPENTVLAGRACLEAGVPALQFNCAAMLDGTVAIMHDSTLDRTTTSSGNVAVQTSMSYSQLVSDPASYLGGSWANISPLPYLSTILDEFGGKVALLFECMDATVPQRIVDAVTARRLEKTVIIASRNQPDLTPAIDAGILTMFIDDAGATDAATLVAAGIGGICTKTATDTSSAGVITQAQIDAYRAAGLKVELHTPLRQSQITRYSGIDLIASDEPVYHAGLQYGDYRHRQSSNPYANGQFPHGSVMAYDLSRTRAALQGGKCRWTNPYGMVLVGALSPVANATGSYTITMTVTWTKLDTDASSYVKLFFAAPTDEPYDNGTPNANNAGYLFLARQNGAWELDRCDGTTYAINVQPSRAAAVAGQTDTITFNVTPTSITATWGTGQTYTYNDGNHRGGFIHQGAVVKTSGSGAGQYDVALSIS